MVTRIKNPDYDYHNYDEHFATCQKDPLLNHHFESLLILDENTDTTFHWKEKKVVKFVAPKPEDLQTLEGEVWNCPQNGPKIDVYDTLVPVDGEGSSELTLSGDLKGNVNGTLLKWSQNEYCITFDPSASNDTELRGKPMHLICTDGTGVNKWCEAYQNYVYPIALCISIIFLIITVFVYITDDSLRKQRLFSHIWIGYLVNLIISLILIVEETLKSSNNQETLGCKIKGYVAQYFFMGDTPFHPTFDHPTI